MRTLYRFAVLIIPTYVDPRDAHSNPFRSTSTLAIDSDPELRGGDDGEHLQGEGERKNSWRWFHTVNRVCSGVKKVRHRSQLAPSITLALSLCIFESPDPETIPGLQTLVLLYVVIPPLSSLPPEPDWVARHPAQALAKFEMREVVVRRFLAGRMRD